MPEEKAKNIVYREMTTDDYDKIISLWTKDSGSKLTIRVADTKENIAKFLEVSPGCSFVAYDGDRLVGTVMGGSDRHRSFINHLFVDPEYREYGIGSKLVALAEAGVKEIFDAYAYITVKKDNTHAIEWWEKHGYSECAHVVLMWKNIHPEFGDGTISIER